MEDKFEQGVERGMDLGREQGYTIAKEAFDNIIKTTKAKEASKKAGTSDSGTQTDTPATTATSTQTNIIYTSLTSQSTSSTQTTPCLATTGTQTNTGTSQHIEIGLFTCIVMSQHLVHSVNGKKGKTQASTMKGTTTGQILLNPAIFSSPTPSATPSYPNTTSTATIALETRSKTINFTQKHEKNRKLIHFNQNYHRNLYSQHYRTY